MNLFEYAFNNPLRWIDPFGLESEDLFDEIRGYSVPYQLIGVLGSEAGGLLLTIGIIGGSQILMVSGGVMVLGFGIMAVYDWIKVPDAGKNTADQIYNTYLKDHMDEVNDMMDELDKQTGGFCPLENDR